MTQEATEVQADGEGRRVLFGEVPADQRFSFKITPLPGRLLDLRTTAESLAALAKLHAHIGEDIEPSVKWKSCIAGAELEPDGSFRVDIVVAMVKKKERKPTAPVGDGNG